MHGTLRLQLILLVWFIVLAGALAIAMKKVTDAPE